MRKTENNHAFIDGANLHSNKCSILLKRTDVPIVYINHKRAKLEFEKEKAPDADKTA
jgi:hypothetical protein